MSDGQALLSSVLTVDRSDWATGTYDGDPTDFRIRVTVSGGVIRVQVSSDGRRWPLVRLAPFPSGGVLPRRADVLHARARRPGGGVLRLRGHAPAGQGAPRPLLIASASKVRPPPEAAIPVGDLGPEPVAGRREARQVGGQRRQPWGALGGGRLHARRRPPEARQPAGRAGRRGLGRGAGRQRRERGEEDQGRCGACGCACHSGQRSEGVAARERWPGPDRSRRMPVPTGTP